MQNLLKQPFQHENHVMIKSFKNKKYLQVLVIVGLLCPIAEQANPYFFFQAAYILNKPIVDKVASKLGAHIATAVLGTSIAAHLKGNLSRNFEFFKSDFDYLDKPTPSAPQVVTQGIKKVTQTVVLPENAPKIKAFFERNRISIPGPSSMPSVAQKIIPTPRIPKISIFETQAVKPSITFAVAPMQPALKQIIAATIKAPSATAPTFTKVAATKAILDKINQNTASPALVNRITSSPNFSSSATIAFKQSIVHTNTTANQPNIAPANGGIKFELMPTGNSGVGNGKEIFAVIEQDQQIQRYIASHKSFLDGMQQKLTVASQQSLNPGVVEEQILLMSRSISQPHLNAKFSVQKAMMLPYLYNSNDGEFQGCHCPDIQKQLETYANGNLWTFSHKRFWNWIKSFWPSNQDIIEKISTNPYNLNLYNFVVQFKAKNFEGAAHFLNLIRPDNQLDGSSRSANYKNMYNSFINQFIDTTDPSILADKVSMVCKDHPNQVIRDIFAQLFTEKTILKKFVSAYVKNYQDIQIPQEIATQKFTELRTLYLKLVTINPANPLKAQQVRQGLLYIKEACSEKPQAAVFNKLAHSVYQQLALNPGTTFLHCRNFAQSFSSPEAQQIQQEILPLISQAAEQLRVTSITATDESLSLSKKCATDLLHNANILYDALARGDLSEARFIKEQVLPTLTPEYVKKHGNPLEAMTVTLPVASQPISLAQQAILEKVISIFLITWWI